jgi:hypothetical protein
MEKWNIEYSGSKGGMGMFFSISLPPYKNRSPSIKPNIPTLHYSNTPWHSVTPKPDFSDRDQRTMLSMLE